MSIRLDYTNMMAPPIDGGITDAEWRDAASRFADAHTLGVNDCLPAAAPATAKEIAKRRHAAFGLSGRIQRAVAARACPASLRPGG